MKKLTIQMKPEEIPRPEYPRPRFYRAKNWLSLNGAWFFAFDINRDAEERGLTRESTGYEHKIKVPFCPESRLSGIAHKGFIRHCAYYRDFEIPLQWDQQLILLHFDAVDFASRVFLDGLEIGEHRGGGTGFSFRLDVAPGKHHLAVLVDDLPEAENQGHGKQSISETSSGCMYSRVTGIWRSVWLEALHPNGLKGVAIATNIDTCEVIFTPDYYMGKKGDYLRVSIRAGKRLEVMEDVPVAAGVPFALKLSSPQLWSPQSPFLYQVCYEVIRAGKVIDRVKTHFGMRKVHYDSGALFLNNQPFYCRFVLDQGYWPDGLWTAPSDAAIRKDIMLARKMGFNGARLHQKLFEDRYLYWADRLGFAVFCEYPSWGLDLHDLSARENFCNEWRNALLERRDHPCVIGWIPFNETFLFPNDEGLKKAFPTTKALRSYRQFIGEVYDLTKALDPGRPVCDASGWFHVKTDLWCVHLYRENARALKEVLDCPETFVMVPEFEVPYAGQPFLVDEWGGFRLLDDKLCADEAAWGYGKPLQTGRELLLKIREQLQVLLASRKVSGYCYTQLTDIEQEQNGLLREDRTAKLPLHKLCELFSCEP